ncbi:hypothetical protein BHE74_00054065 [Ensete ventricosum]|nr:hypothetical protein GW17_00019395 [Ensete ventricosum]RWW40516.1 hypothetical protein BHE74_00054065 [Ensete ventricosum]RZR75836.1 hypothetical protein BHM03_00000340 [Ensete ventricosum]
MKAGGCIINTTSVNAYKGHKTLLDYTSTKGAIVAFTRALALQLADKGIRVNGVAPGPVWTPLIPASFPEEVVANFGKEVPMGRAGQPCEIAPSYVFLASTPDSSYITGQVIHPNELAKRAKVPRSWILATGDEHLQRQGNVDVEVEQPQFDGGAKARRRLQLQQALQHRAAHVLHRLAEADVHQPPQHVETQAQLQNIQRARGRRRGSRESTAAFGWRPDHRGVGVGWQVLRWFLGGGWARERRVSAGAAGRCGRTEDGDDEEESYQSCGGHWDSEWRRRTIGGFVVS